MSLEHSPTRAAGPRRGARTREVAAYIPCSESYLEKLRCTGLGPVFEKIGKIVIYDLDDVDRWLAERKRRSTSEPSAADRAQARRSGQDASSIARHKPTAPRPVEEAESGTAHPRASGRVKYHAPQKV